MMYKYTNFSLFRKRNDVFNKTKENFLPHEDERPDNSMPPRGLADLTADPPRPAFCFPADYCLFDSLMLHNDTCSLR